MSCKGTNSVTTSCEECKVMKRYCERLGEEKLLKQKWKVTGEQDQLRKKQRLEDMSELGSVQPWGMLDWAKLFRGIVDAIKSLEVMVKVQNQCYNLPRKTPVHQSFSLNHPLSLRPNSILSKD